LRIGVTGAGGFVGQALVGRLASEGFAGDLPRVVAIDANLPETLPLEMERAEGDLYDPAFRAALFAEPFDLFFHLAAVPGGAAERDYGSGWKVNVEATIAILDALAAQAKPPRLVFASSIAVFGERLPTDGVFDDTLPLPSMSYGAHKLMMETLIADLARRGKVDGVALRLSGILARPRVKGGHLSAYMSDILHALRAGEPFTCPVSEDAPSWFMSRARCVDNLMHAATLPGAQVGTRRAFTLPALRLTMGELVDGAATHFGREVCKLVTYEPDVALQALFGSYPPLSTEIAKRLGFRDDGSAAELVCAALGLDASPVAGVAA
jgi:nucleoside-diphosphate-sugar epimerase